MPLYATASVEELRSKVDLIELIGSYMPLKKYGAQFKACCPFHQEKTPSFYVYPDHYHCFGCNAHGDAMGFIMQYLKLSFIESIELLAEKFQVRLERAEEAGEKIPVKEMKELMLNAARLFHLHLLFTEEGKEAQKYLFERGISLEFIERSMLGLAPLDPELIVGMLGKENPLLKEVGLVMKQRQNHCFFISRLMFPIRDYQGAVIGFSGRHYKKESTGGKYINTPETPLFHKGSVLFGFDSARLSIAREGVAIITEGQIDTLRMQYAGFENTVSALGTAFGEAHVKKLVQLGISKAILLFDSDKAGHAAALKVGQLFQCAAVEARAALLPKGEDPDSFLRRHLKGQMDNVLGSAMPFLEFALKYYRHLSGGDSPALRQEVVRKMM
ncbi:MAG: DNA primase, partial [Chlamydiae bacterium RIFCSPHIGHO2_12_FULL_49_11]